MPEETGEPQESTTETTTTVTETVTEPEDEESGDSESWQQIRQLMEVVASSQAANLEALRELSNRMAALENRVPANLSEQWSQQQETLRTLIQETLATARASILSNPNPAESSEVSQTETVSADAPAAREVVETETVEVTETPAVPAASAAARRRRRI